MKPMNNIKEVINKADISIDMVNDRLFNEGGVFLSIENDDILLLSKCGVCWLRDEEEYAYKNDEDLTEYVAIQNEKDLINYIKSSQAYSVILKDNYDYGYSKSDLFLSLIVQLIIPTGTVSQASDGSYAIKLYYIVPELEIFHDPSPRLCLHEIYGIIGKTCRRFPLWNKQHTIGMI